MNSQALPKISSDTMPRVMAGSLVSSARRTELPGANKNSQAQSENDYSSPVLTSPEISAHSFSLADFFATLQHLDLPIVAVDPQGIVVFCNDVLLAQTRHTRDQILHRSFLQTFMPRALHDVAADNFKRLLHEDALPARFETTILVARQQKLTLVASKTKITLS
jgi:PAS domain-containing protein